MNPLTTQLWVVPDIGVMVRVFSNGSCSIPGRVIPKTLKMVLDPSLLHTQHYKVRIKGKAEKSWERSSVLPYRKRCLRVTLDYGRQLYGLNSITTVFQQGCLQHWITHEGWYAIKRRNQANPIYAVMFTFELITLVRNEPPYPPNYGLNSITSVFYEGGFSIT